MREFYRLSVNLIAFLLVTSALCVLQSSFRPFASFNSLSWVPSPINWLPVVVYLSLYRKPLEGILSTYFVLLFGLSILTIENSGLSLALGLSVFLLCQAIKSRVFWNGAHYFILLCFLSTLLLQFVKTIVNLVFFDHFALPNVFLWILQAGLTALPAWFCFHLLNWLDHLTHKESLAEVTGDGLL